MSVPATQDVEHNQGDTFEVGVLIEEEISKDTFVAVDLTPWTFTAQVRNIRDGVLVTTVTCTKLNQGTDKGWVVLRVEKELTVDWPKGPGLEFDLQYEEGTDRFTIWSGRIIGKKQVTLP